MRRRTFDALVSVAGIVLAAVLLAAGGLLLWGHSFVDSQVSAQLSAQKIVFPARSNPEFKALPPADAAAMGQYAGQQMTTGAQAEVYADNFIAFHLSKSRWPSRTTPSWPRWSRPCSRARRSAGCC
jgi:hypothetical protein